MSQLGDILNEALALAAAIELDSEAVFPLEANARRGLVALEQISVYPCVMAYTLAETAELIPDGDLQEARAIAVALLVVLKGNDLQEYAYRVAEAIRDALYTDRTLDGVCLSLFVSEILPFENPNSAVFPIRITVAVTLEA